MSDLLKGNIERYSEGHEKNRDQLPSIEPRPSRHFPTDESLTRLDSLSIMELYTSQEAENWERRSGATFT